MKQKAFSSIFKRVSFPQNCLRLESAPLKDINKWAEFYNSVYSSACCSSAYIFTKKRDGNFNSYAKILLTPILHGGTTREAYLEPSLTCTMELFYKNY